MKDLYNAKLIDVIPYNLRKDPDIIAACEMEDNSFFSVSNMAKKVLILPNVQELDESVLDNLSWQLNVDFYEADLDISKKRDLIENAIEFHMAKGTADAVERMLSIVFDKSVTEEWFEYDGQPFMFKVHTTDIVSKEQYEKFRKVIRTVKNSRSHLESFIIERCVENNMVSAVGVQRIRKHSVGLSKKKKITTTLMDQVYGIGIHKKRHNQIGIKGKSINTNNDISMRYGVVIHRYKKLVI